MNLRLDEAFLETEFISLKIRNQISLNKGLER